MTTRTTINCVKYLLNQGMNISDILVSNPTVPVRTFFTTSQNWERCSLSNGYLKHKFGRLVCRPLGWVEFDYNWLRHLLVGNPSRSHKL